MSLYSSLFRTRVILAFLIAAAISCLPAKSGAQGQMPIDWKFTGVLAGESVAYSPDGKTLADAGLTVVHSPTSVWPSSFGVVETWSLVTGSLVAKAQEPTELLSLAFSPDGKYLATGGVSSDEYPGFGDFGGTLYTFTVPNLQQQTSTTTGAGTQSYAVTPTVYSPDGSTILGGGISTSGYPNVWNASTGALIGSIGNINTGNPSVYAFSPDGKTIAAAAQWGNSAIITFFDSTTYEVSSSFTIPALWVASLAYSPDGSKLAIGRGSLSPYADEILIYDSASGNLLETLQSAANGSSFPIAFSADGTMIADGGQAGGWGGVLEVWNVATGKKTYSLNTQVSDPFGVAFSPNGSALAVAGQTLTLYPANPYGKLEIWSLSLQKVLSNPILAPGTGLAASPAFTSDGKTLYVGSDLGVQAFNTSNYGMLGYFMNRGQNLALSPDGAHLAYQSSTSDLAVASIPVIKSYAISSLTLNPSTVAGGATAVGTVTLSAPAPAGGVTLEVFVARILFNDISTVFIPAGSKSATFTVATTTAEEQTVLPITVSNGPNSKTANLSVSPLPPTISSFTVSPTSFIGGNGAQMTVKFASPILGSQVPVYFTSSNTNVVTVPLLTYAFQGNSQALQSLNSTPVLVDTAVTLTARIGTSIQTANVTIQAPTLSQISVPSASLQGGTTETATATLTGNTTKYGLPVLLTSSNPAVEVPSKVNIPGASSKATFTLSAKPVSASTSVTITGTTGSVSQTVTINVLPAQLLSLALNPSSVKGGASSLGTVTLNGPAGPSGANVSLSSNVGNADVPATVTIPAGKTSATFKITTTAVTTQTTATISATLNGITQTANLKIN